jgi:hypothetical protein
MTENDKKKKKGVAIVIAIGGKPPNMPKEKEDVDKAFDIAFNQLSKN